MSANDLAPGQKLDHYELLLPIARGGMAQVWVAVDLRDVSAGLFAVKTVLPALSDDERFRRMFASEARLASGIRHENVCAVHEHGRALGFDYLVMEWLDGESLATLLAVASPLPDAIALRIACDAAAGLHSAHELCDEAGRALGLVHRDVSPQNLLITQRGMTKVADFGVAKATLAAGAATQTGSIKGKADYLSPEQAFSEPLDRRSDVFALGAVLYEMTTGHKPFAADTQLATLVKITSAEGPAAPSTRRDSYPELLEAIVLRALAKDKAERYADMSELAAALHSVGGLASRQEVADYLRESCGERLGQRERAIALCAPPAAISVREVPVRQQRPAYVRWAPALGVVLLVGAGVGVGVGATLVRRDAAPAPLRVASSLKTAALLATVSTPPATASNPAPALSSPSPPRLRQARPTTPHHDEDRLMRTSD